jgi:hypothetical protein
MKFGNRPNGNNPKNAAVTLHWMLLPSLLELFRPARSNQNSKKQKRKKLLEILSSAIRIEHLESYFRAHRFYSYNTKLALDTISTHSDIRQKCELTVTNKQR